MKNLKTIWLIFASIVTVVAGLLVIDHYLFQKKESLRAHVYLAPFVFPLESLSEVSVDDYTEYLKNNADIHVNNETINPEEKEESNIQPSQMLNQFKDYLRSLEHRNLLDTLQIRSLGGLIIIKIINDGEIPVKDILIYVKNAKIIGMAGEDEHGGFRLDSKVEKKEEFTLPQIAQGDSKIIYVWTYSDFSDMSARFFEERIKVSHGKGVGDISIHTRVGPVFEFLDRYTANIIFFGIPLFVIFVLFVGYLLEEKRKENKNGDPKAKN